MFFVKCVSNIHIKKNKNILHINLKVTLIKTINIYISNAKMQNNMTHKFIKSKIVYFQ